MKSYARIILILCVFLLNLSCGGGAALQNTATPLPSETPAATATITVTPTPVLTSTPTPTPTPESYYGITEPAVIKDISMKCVGGTTQKDTAWITFIEVRQEGSVKVGKDEVRSPKNGFAFHTLLTTLEINFGCLDSEAVGRELNLVCGDDTYKTSLWGLEFRDVEGKMTLYHTYVYEIPQATEFSACHVLLPNEKTVPMAPLSGD
jgi:hypothetical protein